MMSSVMGNQEILSIYIYKKSDYTKTKKSRVLVIALNYVTNYVWKQFGEGSESLVVRCLPENLVIRVMFSVFVN